MSADTLTNPLLVRNALPNFDAISPEHVGPAVSSALANAEQRVEQLRRQSQIDFDWALELEDIRQSIGQVFSPIAHLSRVVSSPAMRDAYNDCLPKITEFMTRLGQDPSLLRGYEDLKTQHAVTSDSIRTQLVEHALRDLRLAGIALPPEEQNEF
ncbi:MAG: oligopeptidase A, partial [Gammaproteobacteria bacterium]